MTLILGINWLAVTFSLFVVGCLLGALFSPPIRKAVQETATKFVRRDLLLAKVFNNPVLVPGAHPWMAEAVLNPAAAALGGRTHLIYRAIGTDGVSRLGYASSAGGIVFDERLPYPVYVAQDPHRGFAGQRRYSPVMYASGGSWGGCEDPRMVVIDGRVYVTFNAFDNWNLRVACISISTEDFLAKRWNWTPAHYLSPDGGRDKNWTIFPEKINGQFAILHSIIGDTPDQVRIEYANDIDTYDPKEHHFYSPDPQQMPDTAIAWHVHTRSAGPPPIKTKLGWLVLYHANDAKEWQQYKLGAMLLDLTDPTKVLYRAAHPVLEPDEWYENEGKPGIVYASGAVVRNEMLYVYYGGADKVVCVAYTHLDSFLKALVAGKETRLSPSQAQTA